MRALKLLATGLFLVCLVVGVRAEEKDNKEKILGTWVQDKTDVGNYPVGSVFVFAKDGKVKLTIKKPKDEESADGTYSVEGDKLVVKLGDKEKKHTIKLKKLTETEMVWEAEKGKLVELKRKK
jgi:uncharacterized protein (TIGR03066 family)